jgi:predicted permease
MSWIRRLFNSRRMDRELDSELQHHFDLLVAARVRSGMTEEEARREARMEFGGLEQVKEDCRESRGTMLAVSALYDLRYALRQVGRNPGFAAVTVLTLALGIGATTTIFSIVNATLLRPLPYKDPARLVVLWSTIPHFGSIGASVVTDPNFTVWERENRVFDGIAAFHEQTSNLTGDRTPERLLGASTTAGLFPLLGVAPELGRVFSREQQVHGREDVVLLSDQLWARRFGSDPKILGKPIRLDGTNYTVIGVMPPDFQFPNKPDFWIPTVLFTGDQGDATNQVIARLKPGITMQRASDDMAILQKRIEGKHPHEEIHVTFASLQDKLVANIRPALIVLLAAVGLVLLIACANVANLFLTRATARRPEILMRRALGASRSRIVRQLLTESLLLAGIGGVLGLLFAVATRHLILDIVPTNTADPGALVKNVSSAIDGWVLAFATLTSLATGILFGLAPAWNVSRSGAHSSAKLSGTTQTSEPGTRRIRDILVVGEFALTVVLLVGAGLLLKSMVRLLEVNPGIEPRNVVTLNLELPETKYSTGAEMRNFHDAVLDRIDALPGVRAAGTIGFGMPFGDGGIEGDFTIDGQTQTRPESASKTVVSPGYFRALGIPLIAGRLFNRDDTTQTQPVVIVSRSFAERIWPGQQAIGKRVGHLFLGIDTCIVAGVVGDVKSDLAGEAPLTIYLPYSQIPDKYTWLTSSMTIVIRTESNPLGVLHAAREAVQSVDPEIPIFGAASMDDLIAKSVSQPRFDSILLATFAALALMLAAVGIYGVLSYSVVQRRQEIGIRMALGAGRGNVTRMVVREGAVLASTGIALGIVASLAVSRLIAAFLFGVTPRDPATFCGVSLLLLVVALLACYLPARRASRVDPMVALRYE